MQTVKTRSACTSLQTDQGLHYLLTESLDTIECINREQRPGQYFVHAKDDLNLRIFSHVQGRFFD